MACRTPFRHFCNIEYRVNRQNKKEVSIWNINSFAEFYLQIYGKYEDEYKKPALSLLKKRKIFNELKTIPYLK